ncbi:uncharacterized protein LOC113501445 [Trichoplusia ni]|uniref:Regulatory protein zeste n=1 Tax=Trichoplusia ni TaxID=7111 RepID=A0A7E5WCD5_TRINI|nr:uncharacterized protein LOC113501445 [Trichoplusia ni]
MSQEMEDDSLEEKPSASVFSRFRSPTFSKEEVKALMKIVEKYKSIVFNKATNAAATRSKEVAWLKIAKLYNKLGFKNVRSADTLKTKWDNLKKRSKHLSRNVMDAHNSEFDEVTTQFVTMMYEAENNAGALEPAESDGEIEFKIHKQPIDQVIFNGNEDNNSDVSSVDGDEIKNRMNRSSNFSPEECNLLLQCVRPEKNIVLSQNTTSRFIKLKNRAWMRITNSYNQLSPEKRTAKVLKTKFMNMKKRAKRNDSKMDFKELSNEDHSIENSRTEIKVEPLFEYRSSLDADIDDGDDRLDHDDKSNGDVNVTLDPLSTVLNTNSGLSSISHSENKEVVKLKIELLNHKMETAKLKRQRLENLMQAEAADRESLAIERSLRLRAARLEAIAAEMKLPPSHPALAYTADEARAQHYIHQYHGT